jgi:cell fate regulator YaaT (PSP1 superfamily)
MHKIAEVFFKFQRSEYYKFSPELNILPGKYVIVEADKGIDLGRVAHLLRQEEYPSNIDSLKTIVRSATHEEVSSLAEIRQKEMEAKVKFEEALLEQPFYMDLVDVEYQFDGNRLTFYFMSDSRIDFREFLKVLAKIFHTRIELRQVSAHQAIERLGGIGPCGRELCCKLFRWKPCSVNAKMLEYQNITVTTSKLTGVCGHLLCCIAYELDFYEEEAKHFPNLNDTVSYQGKKMRVVKNDYLTSTVFLEDKNSITHQLLLEAFNKILLEKDKKSKESITRTEPIADTSASEKVKKGMFHCKKKRKKSK